MQLLLPDSGQPRGAGGAAGAPSARASRCSSQSLCWLQAAFLLMQQARAAKHWERRSGDKGCLSVAWASSRPAVWASRPGRKPHFCSWDFFGFLSKFVSSCARTSVSELPSGTASSGYAPSRHAWNTAAREGLAQRDWSISMFFQPSLSVRSLPVLSAHQLIL